MFPNVDIYGREAPLYQLGAGGGVNCNDHCKNEDCQGDAELTLEAPIAWNSVLLGGTMFSTGNARKTANIQKELKH